MKGYTKFRRVSKAEGSVSIFLIMILAFVFLFTAVLIDYVRIAAVNVQEERLARAGVRSVMSSYDIELREKYGLFAFGNSDGNMLLSQVLNDNLHKSGRGDTFNIVPFTLESSSIEWSRSLGRYDVFRRQITEEMKYKGPIDFALELAGKFKPLSAAMGEATRATQVLTKLQPLYDEREEALDLMLDRRSQAAESSREQLRLFMDPLRDYISSDTIGSVQTAADIAAQYNDYVGKSYADYYRDSKDPPRYSYERNLYQNQSSRIISKLANLSATTRENHDRLIEESRAALKMAEELNDEMRAVLERSRNESGNTVSHPAEDWDIPGSSAAMSAEALTKIREQEDSLLIPSVDMANMVSNIASQERAYRVQDALVNGLPGILIEAQGLDGDSSRMKYAVLNASRTMSTYLHSYSDSGSIIASERAFIEQHRSSDKERKRLEKEAKSKLGEAKKLMDKIGALGDGAADSMERYQKLRQYYEENISYNNGLALEPSVESKVNSDPNTAGNSAMTNMDGTYAAMSSIMAGARDRLFQTEYSALYFQHFDVSKLVALAHDSEATTSELTDQLDPRAQELEYILYGFHNPAGNVAAAYSEIFAMRLAIRTMEGFIEKASLGNPLAVLAAALLYGIQQAIQDMLMLSEQDAIPLSKYMPAQLTYRDHLRLFMMLHGGGEVQLSRMLALIRLDSGINPAERNTYASADIRLGMRLWFLPGVIKMVDYSAGLSGEVKGNTYYRTVKADFSY